MQNSSSRIPFDLLSKETLLAKYMVDGETFGWRRKEELTSFSVAQNLPTFDMYTLHM